MRTRSHIACGSFILLLGAACEPPVPTPARDASAGLDAAHSGKDSSAADVSVEPVADAAVEPGPDASAPDAWAADAQASSPDARPEPPQPVGTALFDGGVGFRVWAPNASAAWVTVEGLGTFSMEQEIAGYFHGAVAGAMAGQTYRYWLQNGTHVLQRPDARSRQVSDQESVIVDPTAFAWKTAAFTPPRREESVVYELHVAGYAGKGDANAGTFAGVVDRLDHLVTLGVNVIELMPVNHFSGRGWGYNPLGYYAPNPDYGAPDDLRRLVDEAHQRGIAVWLDVVYNHYDGWTGAPLYCYDGTCPGNSGVYFFAGAPYGSTPWGPRPDYSSPDVAGFILDSVTSWLTEYRVDGFRWDSTSNIRALDGSGEVPGGRSLLQDANDLIHATPNALSIAEDLKGYGDMTLPVDQGGFGFDAQWDGFGWTIDGAVVGSSDAARDVAGVRDAIKGTYNGDPFQRLLFTDNHDVDGNGSVRLAQKIDPTDPGSWAARKRTLLAAGVLLTTPGVPMLFMGQEFLERGGFTDPPKALDWTKEQSYGPVQQAYVDLIRLRRNLDGVSAGLTCPNVDIIQFNDTAKVLAYRRSCADGGEVVAVANFGIKSYPRYDVGLPSGGSWHVRVNTDDLKYSTDFGGASSADVTALAKSYDGLPFTGPIVLGPYSIVVLSK